MGWFSIILCLNSPHTSIHYTRNKIQYIILFNANIFTSALMKIDVLSAVLWTVLYKHKGHGEMWLWMRRLKILPHVIDNRNRTIKFNFHISNHFIVNTFKYNMCMTSNLSLTYEVTLHLCCEHTFVENAFIFYLSPHSYTDIMEMQLLSPIALLHWMLQTHISMQ